MRVVRSLEELPGEVAAAEAEAVSAFGDGTVFLEPYVERGRHVAVQVVGDTAGTVEVFGERDCSLQRRHQKIVEEAPAPGLSQAIRRELHEAARAVAGAVRYVGAGTVEFVLDLAADRFFFLEMNTRLQVEHAVTEQVYGVDLVAVQLAVAEGRRVPPAPAVTGHAIEARLYAEDPAAGYAPQSGTLTRLELPPHPGLRVDAGYETGSEMSTYYDALVAKVIARAPTREQAARLLAGALSRARIHGLRTNRDQLVAVLRHPDFLAARVSTAFLHEHPAAEPLPAGDHAVAAALALAEHERAGRTVQRSIPVGWRNVPSQPQVTRLTGSSASPATRGAVQADDPITVEWWGTRDGYRVPGLSVLAAGPGSVRLARDGVATTYAVAIRGDRVDVDSPSGHVALRLVPRFTDPADTVVSGSLLATMPGTVVDVAVEKGDRVEAGQPVVVLEAMKMQHTVTAPHAGEVTQLEVRPGIQVAAGEVLAVVSTSSTDGSTDEETQ
jgi:propionyl-CoA carboxylase alpha chain